MGLMMSKYYIDSHDPPPLRVVKGISVYYEGKVHILYSNVVLSDGIEIHAIEDDIELSYPADDKVMFSLRENLVHFIVIGDHEKKEVATKTGAMIKTDSVKYPWRSEYDGIRVSRMTEEEYKDTMVSRSMFSIS
jgi:IMP cyclohydrolase